MQAVPNQSASSPSFETLIAACQRCVNQCQQLLETIPEPVFGNSIKGSASVGAHIRHIIERYQCVLNGLPEGGIDYDHRNRDRNLEVNLSDAGKALLDIQKELEGTGFGADRRLTVVESVNEHCPSVAVTSTLQRELMGLVSHTIHHLAIIALLVKSQGINLDIDFGKAPSTIIYERSAS